MKKLVTLSLFCLLFHISFSQQINLQKAKFTTENNIEFINSDYDDSKWKEINTGEAYETQSFEGYNGYSWYRIKTTIPSSLKSKSLWKDSLKFNFGCIDDCDEIYLNGILINKSGSFPDDSLGYITTWNILQEIHLSVNNPAIFWDKENVIAVKLYDGVGNGGMYKNKAFIKMVDVLDNVKMKFEYNRSGVLTVTVENKNNKPLEGYLSFLKNEDTSDIVLKNKIIQANSSTKYEVPLNVKNDKSSLVEVKFTESLAATSITKKYFVPYVLTPSPSKKVSINTPSNYGIRPNHPVLYKIPASGEQPMFYAISNLPKGLKLDAKTGVITGMLKSNTEVSLNILVKNKLGTTTKNMLLQCGKEIALTPPMGWSSWNCWGLNISDEKIKAAATGMVNKGLINFGYNMINIDDGWEANKRNADGTIEGNDKFKNMKALGDFIHAKGLKFGIYSSPGQTTCGGFLGSLHHELQDAETYNNWGVDFLKYDWCSYYNNFYKENDSSLNAYKKPYLTMQAALAKQPRDIVYSLCQYGMKDVWQWGESVGGNLWRTTGDIEDTWASLSGIGFAQTKQQAYAKPGHWNDTDMMVLGNLGWGDELRPSMLTPDEQYTHMSLWCLLNNPLLIGCDITTMDDFTLNLLTNTEVIAIDQNIYASPAMQIVKNDSCQVWKKKLAEKVFAIGIFNMSNEENNFKINWADVKLSNTLKVRDVWRQKDEEVIKENYNTIIPAHGVKLIVVTE